jgi:hypothetical protein
MKHIARILSSALEAAFGPSLPHPQPWAFVKQLWRDDGSPCALWRRQDVLDVTVYQVTNGTQVDGPPALNAIGFQHPRTVMRLNSANLTRPPLRMAS